MMSHIGGATPPITDVAGLRVGHATDEAGRTGVTVVLFERPAVAGVELRGGANDVVGLDFLAPGHVVPTIDAVVLGGGSRFGEDAIAGVRAWLAEHDVGYTAAAFRIPHVTGAFLFDLSVARVRPTAAMGRAAAAAATVGPVAEGSVGAGAGATVGKIHGAARAMRGGIGTASARVPTSGGATVTIGALMAVNAVGDVRDPATGALVAGTRDAADGRRLIDSARALRAGEAGTRFSAPLHTTIGVVATDARLDKPGAARLASLGMLGFARTLSPPHTAFDGDTLFAVSAGEILADVTTLGLAAADVVADAIVRAVRHATSLPGLPAARDL
ncbi:MAG: P1 family peptidase [Candidatus Rokubacteria bacterium]|nr:P1 family peptidase [Candidatus Rokubacteria bacterium]